MTDAHVEDLVFIQKLRLASLEELIAIKQNFQFVPRWKRVAVDRAIARQQDITS